MRTASPHHSAKCCGLCTCKVVVTCLCPPAHTMNWCPLDHFLSFFGSPTFFDHNSSIATASCTSSGCSVMTLSIPKCGIVKSDRLMFSSNKHENVSYWLTWKSFALNFSCSYCQTIKATVNRWKTGSVNDCPRSGPPKKVPEDHYRCIDNAMAENDKHLM